MDMVYTEQKHSFIFIKNFFHFITRAFLFFLFVSLLSIIILLIVYVSDLFINTLEGSAKKPLFGAYVIMSGSMTPSIMVKDGVIVKRVDHDNYQVGDIITFSSTNTLHGGMTITHRIIEKENVELENSLYTTKGDHNLLKDASLVKTDEIYGKVLFKIPRIGYVQDFFSKPTNYFACLLGISLLIIVAQGGRLVLLMFKEKEAI